MHELSPEVKQALRALLGDDSPAPVSGGVDYEAICAKVKADLQPAIEMIGNELKALREENDQLKDIVFKMVTSFSDAVGSHRQQGLRSSLMEKYGSDIESIGGFYKDAYDSDITEDLLEALMGAEGDPMEMAGESLRTLKEKFGKYQRVEPASVEVEVQAEGSPQGELDLEPKAEGGEPEGEGVKPEEKSEGPPGRASDKLFETVKELRRKTA
jgi:hypothetical protein